MQRNIIPAAAIVFWLGLIGLTGVPGSARMRATVREPRQHPHVRILVLKCVTGISTSEVTNTTKTNIPEDAVITLHGVEAPCTQTASGPLAPGKSVKLPGCPNAVKTCRATAKWEFP